VFFRKKMSSAASVCLHGTQRDVFIFLVDPRNTQRWVETVEYVSHKPHGPIGVGTETMCRVEFLGAKIQARYRIVQLDEPKSFFGEGTSGSFNFGSRFELAPSKQEGFVDVNWSVAIEYPAILPFGASYVTGLVSSELKRTLQNLRKIFI
jgi:carbon monoxide dehydrogenase subunit G